MKARSLGKLGMIGLVLAVSVTCRKTEKPDSEGRELSKNPIKAMGQVQEAAKKAAEAAREAQQRKPVEPVPFAKLIELLPPPPAGWEAAGGATGETSSGLGFTVSKASRRFTKGEQTVDVTILDGAFNAPVYMAVTMASQFKREGTDGYEKGVTLDGNPGVEKFDKDGGHGTLSVVVGKRYLVTIDASGVSPGFVMSIWSAIDRSRLSALS